MAHNVEPMDIDNIDSDFDNKENSIHHSNVYPRTPCTEKGYEELDVSELNMKLRYSITPASSPMSKSYTANCTDNRNLESGDDNINSNLTRSLHSAISKDLLIKPVKTLPLQTISSEQLVENNRNTSVLRPLDGTVVSDNNVMITVTGSSDRDENLSLPSSSSSTAETPVATTPTKDIPRNDGGSPIMRGLKSVLNMFRSSQSPIPSADNPEEIVKVLSPVDVADSTPDSTSHTAVLASTPIAAHKYKESNLSKRSSPLKDSLVFNEDLERELLWKDETTILFSQEKIPIHKLFFQQGSSNKKDAVKTTEIVQTEEDLNSTVEYMDISYNNSMIKNRTITELQAESLPVNESDAEFVDCETTFTNDKNEDDITSIADTENNENKPSSTVTDIVSSINMENTDISTENPVLVMEKLPVIELQCPHVNESLKEEATNIPQVNNEAETLCSQLEISANKSDTTELKQGNNEVDTSLNDDSNNAIIEANVQSLEPLDETYKTESRQAHNEVNTNLNVESNTVIIETNVASESHVPSDETYNTQLPHLHTGVATTDIVTQSEFDNQGKLNMTFETCDIPADIDTIPSTVNNSALETTKTCETNNTTIADSRINVDKDATFAKETENHTITFDYNTNVAVIDEQVKIPNETLDILDSPANIPLPDDEDIENEKSVGGIILVEEGTVPVTFNINNETVTENKNIDQFEFMPTVPAKLTDVNNPINDCFEIKDFVATISENNSEQSEFKHADNVSNNNIVAEIDQIEKEIKPIGFLGINEPMDINDSISNVQTVNAYVQPNTVEVESKDHNLNISSEQVSNDANKTIEFDLKASSIEVINVALTSVNEPTEGTDTTIIKAHELPAVDFSVSENETSNICKIEIELNDHIEMNKTDALKDTVENKEQLEQHTILCESQKPQVFLNETTSISVNINKSAENITEIVPTVEMKQNIEDLSVEQITPENPVKTLLPTMDVRDLPIDIHKVNNKVNQVDEVQATIPEIVKVTDEMEKITANENVDKDEEIILSENNSPFVSQAGQIDQALNPEVLKENENPFATKTKVVLTPPSSPKIVSKGYNFNFDEIDDPFATKTKIRLSPTPDTPEKPKKIDASFAEKPFQRDANKNRRKSQPERKKPVMPKKKINSTFSGSVNVPKAASNIKSKAIEQISDTVEPQSKIAMDDNDIPIEQIQQDKSYNIESSTQIQTNTLNITAQPTENTQEIMLNETCSKEIAKEEKSEDVRDIDTTLEVNTGENMSLDSLNDTSKGKSSVHSLSDSSKETKNTSSSEHSTYYSAGTSSGEGSLSRNVFNLPEIDDVNFNPFVTKSKMRQSPPPNLDTTAVFNNTQDIPITSDTFTENPFETKSNMRQSPQPSLNATATLNATHEHPGASEIISKLEVDVTYTEIKTGFEINKDLESKALSPFDEKEYANISNTTCSSKATDEKDLTVREVHTEDEDTIEGPFLEADDLNNDDKMSDFDGDDVDMMQFSELPSQNVEENMDGGELFIDAEAFEFLLNQNKSNVVTDSGKESLFLKFDPLFAKRMSSDGVLAALNKKRQSTPKKVSAAGQIDATFEKSIAGPSNLNTTHELTTNVTAEESTEDFNVTVTKPMMVVTPAVNPVITPRNRNATPPSSNRRSITFTSPAIAVIDRLLSLSANNSLVGHDTTVTHMSREQTEADLALTQLRELLAEKEINVYNLRTESKELKDRLSGMESQMRILESESQDRLKKINDLNEKLTEKTKLNKSMAAVVEEYERTIASLIAETEQDKKRNNEERIRLIKERDEQTAHLASMEVSFSDLHSKYEKSKQIILTCKANEDAYKKSIKEFEENLTKMQSNYELLKQHATSKLNHANQELEKMNRSHEAEVLKLNAMIKRKELHITSLEETLTQKTKANEELTAICDELINKVG